MRERFQKGHLFFRNKNCVFQYWDGRHRKRKTLGPVGKMTKTEAQKAAAAIIAPINARAVPAPICLLAEFILTVYLTFYRRKWKRSTALTNEDRIKHHITSEFGEEKLSSFTREKLQAFLDRKAESGLSFSVVDHLRWDLKQIFGMAAAEGHIIRNPSQLLFTPRECPRAQKTVMSREEVRKVLFSNLFGTQEHLVLLLALLAGMRPGEIFVLTWQRHFKPQLESVGVGWVNFQVMRRTHSSLLKELDVVHTSGPSR